MSTKLALVVDDSRMARYVLGKMLTEHGIEVDSVESGEEALGYLCDRKPAMIFMDHTMPGMDGFQCLRAIKNDPHTAMIPIIMYTSKEGEVYESQARALGAADVLPKNLKPLTLARVLERQNLLPNQAGVVDGRMAANDVVIVEQSDSYAEPEPSMLQVAQNDAHHAEIEQLEKQVEQLTAQITHLSTTQAEEPPATPPKKALQVHHLALALAGVVMIWLLMSNGRLEAQLRAAQGNARAAEANILALESQNEDLRAQLSERNGGITSQTDFLSQKVYSNIEWALNQEGSFAWNVRPFGNSLAERLSELVDNLDNMGFVGVVNIRSHLGRFCLRANEAGEMQMPGEGMSLNDCEIQQYTPNNAEDRGLAQSRQFENTLADIANRYNDNIRIQLSTAGTRRPLERYPTFDPEMAASEWNAIAAKNQRLEFTINPY